MTQQQKYIEPADTIRNRMYAVKLGILKSTSDALKQAFEQKDSAMVAAIAELVKSIGS